MRADAAVILEKMGHRLDIDFDAHSDGVGGVNIRWLAQVQQPTEAEIDAAAPAILAANAANAADAVQWATDRADLKALYQTGVTRLEQIRDAAAPTNAQVIAAVRDLAAYQLRILKYIRRL